MGMLCTACENFHPEPSKTGAPESWSMHWVDYAMHPVTHGQSRRSVYPKRGHCVTGGPLILNPDWDQER